MHVGDASQNCSLIYWSELVYGSIAIKGSSYRPETWLIPRPSTQSQDSGRERYISQARPLSNAYFAVGKGLFYYPRRKPYRRRQHLDEHIQNRSSPFPACQCTGHPVRCRLRHAVTSIDPPANESTVSHDLKNLPTVLLLIKPDRRTEMSRHTTQEETMSYSRNLFTRESKSAKKKKKETELLQNVISLRINDDEKKTLEKLTKATSKSVSEIMREAIDLWRSKQRKLCM